VFFYDGTIGLGIDGGVDSRACNYLHRVLEGIKKGPRLLSALLIKGDPNGI
jgi:hypothetical protein